MKSYNRALGAWGEQQAIDYLVAHGLEVVERNYHTPYGELDLIAKQGGELIFVEVKTRSSDTFGWPELALTEQKRIHLLNAAMYYLQQHPEFEGNWRVDVIAIRRSVMGKEPPELVWIENVVA
ncbi:MAG: YraN family protein [Thermanaerothrix sp.]|nr:YraN family protein [Thermanaerothrix sp.]